MRVFVITVQSVSYHLAAACVPACCSYEHFYVLYCKFWELDSDHDFLLSRQDLNRLSDVTHVLLDRVFAQVSMCGKRSAFYAF